MLNFTTMPDANTIPAGYVLHYYTTACGHCHTQSSRSDFYALHMLKSRLDRTPVRHLVRCERASFNLPVERVNVGHRNIPYCCDCQSIDLTHLPSPPSAAMLHDIRESTRPAPTTPARPTPAKATTKATLGDLA
jgi:hypothetical protein